MLRELNRPSRVFDGGHKVTTATLRPLWSRNLSSTRLAVTGFRHIGDFRHQTAIVARLMYGSSYQIIARTRFGCVF